MPTEILSELAIALGIGLLIGLQREQAQSQYGGIRTFPLISLMGVVSGWLLELYDATNLVAAGVISLAILAVVSNGLRRSNTPSYPIDSGQTTEVASILVYLLGVYIVVGNGTIAAIIGALIAVLLHLKPVLNEWVEQMTQKDLKAIMTFVAISIIIWPILPDKTFGPYDVLNLREIWTMVVLIVGVSISAYFIYKWVGDSIGTIAGGILGGLISSTATTIAYAKRTTDNENAGRLAALVILMASTVSFARVLFEIGVIIPDQFGQVAPPIVAIMLLMAAISAFFYFWNRNKGEAPIPEPDNPAQLKSAILLAGLYAAILLAVAAAKDMLGESGLYIVSIISGLTDVDAITLSLSSTIKNGGMEATEGSKFILIGALSNMAFKAGLAVTIGSKKLGKYVLFATALILTGGILALLFWPLSWYW